MYTRITPKGRRTVRGQTMNRPAHTHHERRRLGTHQIPPTTHVRTYMAAAPGSLVTDGMGPGCDAVRMHWTPSRSCAAATLGVSSS